MDYVGSTENFALGGEEYLNYTVYLTIVDDDILESNETFKAALEVVDETFANVFRVTLQPNEAEVLILDSDSESVNYTFRAIVHEAHPLL